MAGTLFKQVGYTLSSLVQFIDLGQIGLPDIQRPFVWKNIKVRDLFDSMYRGYPVGYLLFWQNAYTEDPRHIGGNGKQKIPHLLIVDGQQRLTSLYAVLKGQPVLREDFERNRIEIAFNPLQEKFEVSDAAIRKDRSYIPDISVVWSESADLFDLADGYLEGLRTTRDLLGEEDKSIKRAITRLHGLKDFPFTALELASEVSEEQVAEVFVRINSKGTPLNQADFILTLMSVFWDEGRKDLETFSYESRQPSKRKASPYNHFIEPDPDMLLRVGVALGFRRARLQHVYSILRGKDLETEEFSVEQRDAQFEVLKAAQARVLNPLYWQDFFQAIRQAGYRGGRMISSNNNLIYTYVFYLLGRTEYGVDEHDLRKTIAQWFFMSSLTGRYTGSPESAMEFDLARLRDVKCATEYVQTLRGVCEAALTSDFWSITLPNELATSSPKSPSLFAYYAALVLLEARALFSKQKITDLLDPSVHSSRKAAERHHLFPRAYLKSIGIEEIRRVNQIANYAVLEWGDNDRISSSPPSEYMPVMIEECGLNEAELRQQYYWHALPDGWGDKEFDAFLERRREMIAGVIRDGYQVLRGDARGAPEYAETLHVEEFIRKGEGKDIEFKATLRVNLHTGKSDPRMELAVIKTIAGFLNDRGGTLIIGVADDGTPVGIEEDGFPNEDKMHLHLINLIKSRLGANHGIYIHPRFEDFDETRVLAVECWPARSPVYVKDGNVEKFFVRTGAATTELPTSQVHQFIKDRFS